MQDDMHDIGAAKFDVHRAGEYERQSRIGLAGYEACHELAACMLAASLGDGPRHVLVVGAGGTGQEVQSIGGLQPAWRFTAVDPSPPMLEQAIARLHASGLADRTTSVSGHVRDIPLDTRFDAATVIGVLHHVQGTEAQMDLLRSVADRLPSGAPLVLAGNAHAYASRPLLLKAWAQRWRMFGAGPDEVQAKLGKILHGADPPASEWHALQMLAAAGFGRAERFFSSLFWTAWITFRN